MTLFADVPVVDGVLLASWQREVALRVSQRWHVSKTVARGWRGLVVAQAQPAAEVGVQILEAGGNAVDAAVAIGLALGVVEPWASGLGGVGFALIASSGKRRAVLVDFGPVAPAALDPGRFRMTGRPLEQSASWPEVEGDANVHGPLSFAIPSAVAGWHLMQARRGRLPWPEVVAPALALARRGLLIDWFSRLRLASTAPLLRKYPASAALYLSDTLPSVGTFDGSAKFLRVERLCETLDHLGRAGPRDFYTGDIGASIVADAQQIGAALSREDMQSYGATEMAASVADWSGRSLQLAGNWSAAPRLAELIALMHGVPTDEAPDAEWFVALARAMLDAYSGGCDRGGPQSCASHVTVCDAEGLVVAMTVTLLSHMGSQVVLPGTGVLMNNGIMWFDPAPGRPNSLAPGTRPRTDMCPVILIENNEPSFVVGASGGGRIMPAIYQVLAFAADFRMGAEAANHHPRINVCAPDRIVVDARLPAKFVEALRRVGGCEIRENLLLPSLFAHSNIALRASDGAWTGVTDTASPWSIAIARA